MVNELFCFDRSCQLKYNHDYTGEHVCGGYQKIVQKSYYQEKEEISWYKILRLTTVAV